MLRITEAPSKWAALIVSAIIALAFALRFSVFTLRELGLDGGLAVGLASIAVPDMLAFNLRDVHPPLFYLALRGWLAIAGTTFIAAKWFTIASGVLAVAVLYQIAKRAFGVAPALMAALLLMASPAHIFLSPTVRDFAPGLLLSLLSVLLLARLIEDAPGSRRTVLLLSVALALTTGAALLTWYFHALYLALEAVWLAARRPKHLASASAALFAGILTAIPWLVVAIWPLLGKASGIVGPSPETAPLDAASFARETVTSLVGTGPLPWPFLLAFWLLLVLLGFGHAVLNRERRMWAIGGLAGAALGFAIVYAVADRWVHGVFYVRYMLVPLPFAVLTQVTLLETRSVARRSAAGLAMGLLLVPAAFWYVAMAGSEPIRYGSDAISLQVEPRIAKDDAVIFTDIARLGFYLLINGGPKPAYSVHYAGAPYLEDDVANRVAGLLPELLAKHRRIWLVDTATYKDKAGSLLRKPLARSLIETQVLREADTEVRLYEAPIVAPRNIVFGDAITLLGYRLRDERAEFAPGEELTVHFVWTAVAPLAKDYSVSLQVLDGAGRLAAQSDGPPAQGSSPTSTWRIAEQIVDTRSVKLPGQAGDYSLGIALYDLASMQRLAAAGAPAGLASLPGEVRVK